MSTIRTRELELEKELEKELECSLCRDLFREPKTLRCLHSFCLECLEIYVEKNHSNINLSCPICRTPFHSKSNSKFKSSPNSNLKPEELIANLSTDSFLLNNLNLYDSLKNSIPEQKQQQQKKKKKQKLICIDGENEATCYCLDCQDYFCEFCSKVHKTMKVTKNHQVNPINEMKDEDYQINSITNSNSNSNNQLNCQIHQQKELELFCDDCKLPICPLCVDQHTSHKIFTLSNIIEIEKQSLIELINQVKPKEKELREGINKCEEVIKELEINSTTTQTQIYEFFHKIRSKLSEREQELLNKLDEIEKYKKKELEIQKDELIFGIESIIGSCQMIQHSISLANINNGNNENVGRLLSMKKLYESRLDYLINNNWRIEPECHSLIEFSVCEKDEQSIYSTISNIGILDSNEISIEKCLISRNEKQRIYENEEFKFEIISYSKEGNKMKKGGNGNKFNIQFGKELNDENINNEENESEIKDLNNGNYEAKMKIKNEGKYLISLQYNRFDIVSSPFQIQVLSKLKQRNYDEINEPKLTFGNEDENNDEWSSLYGITIDSNGNILACDWAKNEIQIFGSEGKFISSFGSYGKGNGQFNYPTRITINSKGNIIVSDQGNHRIQIFDSEGNFILTFGSNEKENGQFNSPEGICVDSNDNIYVCDSFDHRIQIFDSQGNFISTFGSKGNGNGQLDEPVGITANSKRNIIVSDYGNHRIQIFDSEGNFISTFGSKGNGHGQFMNPHGICVDLNDNIFVCDHDNNRIQIFNSIGEYITQFKVKCPTNIKIDSQTLNIVVCNENGAWIF